MLLPLKRYAEFSGRSTRREFWMFFLLVNLVVLGLSVLVIADIASNYGQMGALGVLAISSMAVVFLGSLVPLLAVEARRLNDQDIPGWLVVINLLPYLGAFIVLVLMLIDGTHGDNRFGADPFNRESKG